LGIEMTTGPLGQGFGTGVGMALAEAHLRSRLGEDLVNHRTFGFVSDGDLMEGVSSEAASLAGHFGLGRLIYLYDDNRITIDGPTDITFSEDVASRFQAVGWHTVAVDGHDRDEIASAIEATLDEEERPSLVICRTHIGHGSPNFQDTADAHGKPLGADEIKMVKYEMGFPVDEDFHVPDGVREFFTAAMNRGREARAAWHARFDSADPSTLELWEALYEPKPVSLEDPGFETGEKLATRSSTGKLFTTMATASPGLIGGS